MIRQGESFILGFQTAEKLCEGGNSPEMIQRLCSTIISCDASLECSCLNLESPASTECPLSYRYLHLYHQTSLGNPQVV